MIEKIVKIKNDDNAKIKFILSLNKLTITIVEKTGIGYKDVYSKENIKIDRFSNIEKIIYNIYLDYLELKTIENLWYDKIKYMKDVEIKINETSNDE